MQRLFKPSCVLLGTGMTRLLAGCGGAGATVELLHPLLAELISNDSVKAAFKPDAQTSALLV